MGDIHTYCRGKKKTREEKRKRHENKKEKDTGDAHL